MSAYGAAPIALRAPLGDALFESQAQQFTAERTDTVRLHSGERSDSWIVILYIRYQSGEGRLSNEVVDQLGKESVAEDGLS